MPRDKYRDALICASTILAALVGALMFLPVAMVRVNPGPNSAASSATFRTQCAICPGQDGAGSAVGKSMNVPDLRSPVVQKLPGAELAQVISNGQGGMPPCKGSLSEDQIHALSDAHKFAASKEVVPTPCLLPGRRRCGSIACNIENRL